MDTDYILCYCRDGKNVWEGAYGEDAMQIRVSELTKELSISPEDIIVFLVDSQLG